MDKDDDFEFDINSVSLNYSFDSHFRKDDPKNEEPDDAITKVIIIVNYYNDEDAINEKIAKVVLYKIESGISNCNLSYILDIDSDTADFVEILSPEGDCYTENISQLLEGNNQSFETGTFLILSRLEILPKYRNIGLPEIILNDVNRWFSHNVDMLVLKAFPLQFQSSIKAYLDSFPTNRNEKSDWLEKMQYSKLNGSEEIATNKLIVLYSKLGFQSISNEPSIMIKPL